MKKKTKKKCSEQTLIADEYYKFVQRVRKQLGYDSQDYMAYIALGISANLLKGNLSKKDFKSIMRECSK